MMNEDHDVYLNGMLLHPEYDYSFMDSPVPVLTGGIQKNVELHHWNPKYPPTWLHVISPEEREVRDKNQSIYEVGRHYQWTGERGWVEMEVIPETLHKTPLGDYGVWVSESPEFREKGSLKAP